MQLDEDFWSERYENGQTGWDTGSVTTPIKEYIDQLSEDYKQKPILIPGAGNGYEAEYLINNGFTDVTVIDISLHPIQRLEALFPQSTNLKLVHGDFFDIIGEYDLIIEQTFFCALNPELRPKYAEKMVTLLSPDGKLVGVLFDAPMNSDRPPFGGSEKEYRNLFKKYLHIRTLKQCYNSITPRMGTEVFIHLTRV